MRVAYATTYNVLDRSKWQKKMVGLWGAGYHLAKNLENQSVLIDYLGPLEEKYKTFTTFKGKGYYKLFKKSYEPWAEPLVLKSYAYQLAQKLSRFSSEIILCPEKPQTLAYLECKQPIVFWTDAPLSALIDFYPGLSQICHETKRNILALEKIALEKCQLAIFLSDWAAQSAIKTYAIKSSKIKVVLWGANIECNRNIKDIENIVDSKSKTLCRLLFIGVDWFRKGGDIAVEIARNLNEVGIKTELLVVGCYPTTAEPLPNFVKPLGFIDTYTKAGMSKINELYCEAHFLLMPSRADCSPHVLGEANSFGLPCLTTDVGGLPAIIKDSLNGQTFSLDTSPSVYSHYIASIITHQNEYKKLALSSFNEYQSRLNWSVAVKTAKQLIMEVH